MVFPLYDENPFTREKPPYVTWALIAINVIVFLCEIGSETTQVAMIASFGVSPAEFLHPMPGTSALHGPLALVTCMFLHGSWMHLIGNMIYLSVFGDDIEDALGPIRFILFYLLAGVAAALFHIMLNPASTAPLVGASGAIAGVLAAYLMLRPCALVTAFVLRIVTRIRAYWLIGGWIALQALQLLGKTEDGIAYGAHVGGLIAGAALFFVMRPAHVRLFECMEAPPQAGNSA
ncbi:MAG: rhomboid family intramembrane serine protease [Proteobacteria bacterium]|nr:rhomboid family intramembrane serine protease [Pseudomonadota bacterium]